MAKAQNTRAKHQLMGFSDVIRYKDKTHIKKLRVWAWYQTPPKGDMDKRLPAKTAKPAQKSAFVSDRPLLLMQKRYKIIKLATA